MNRILYAFMATITLILLNLNVFSQVYTLSLQPGPNTGKDAVVISTTPDINYGTSTGLVAKAMLAGGQLEIERAFLQFNLSSIPVGAVIQSARMDLFYDPSNTLGGHIGNNPIYIRRITSAWDENTVTYNNQPLTTELHQLFVPMATSSHQNYSPLSVAQLIQDMVNSPSSSFGFSISLVNEQLYRAVTLASSDNSNAALRPRLNISYTYPCSLIPGTVKYDNKTETPVAGAKVYVVNSQGVTIDSTVTNATGNFSISVCQIGTYVFKTKSTLPWKGVNATDALIAMKHFSGLSNLDGLAYKAGNINNDGSINSIDALLIAKRYVGLENSFPIGNWVSSTVNVNLPVNGEINVSLKLLTAGDLDASRAF